MTPAPSPQTTYGTPSDPAWLRYVDQQMPLYTALANADNKQLLGQWLHLASAALAGAPNRNVYEARVSLLRSMGTPENVLAALGDGASQYSALWASTLAEMFDAFLVDGK